MEQSRRYTALLSTISPYTSQGDSRLLITPWLTEQGWTWRERGQGGLQGCLEKRYRMH